MQSRGTQGSRGGSEHAHFLLAPASTSLSTDLSGRAMGWPRSRQACKAAFQASTHSLARGDSSSSSSVFAALPPGCGGETAAVGSRLRLALAWLLLAALAGAAPACAVAVCPLGAVAGCAGSGPGTLVTEAVADGDETSRLLMRWVTVRMEPGLAGS